MLLLLLLCRRQLQASARARVRGLEFQVQILTLKRQAIALCVQLPPCALRSGRDGGGKGMSGGQAPFGALERALRRSQVGREAGARLGLARLDHVLHRIFDCHSGRFQRRLGRGLRAGVARLVTGHSLRALRLELLDLGSARARGVDSLIGDRPRTARQLCWTKHAQQDNTGWDIVSAGAVQIGPY